MIGEKLTAKPQTIHDIDAIVTIDAIETIETIDAIETIEAIEAIETIEAIDYRAYSSKRTFAKESSRAISTARL